MLRDDAGASFLQAIVLRDFAEALDEMLLRDGAEALSWMWHCSAVQLLEALSQPSLQPILFLPPPFADHLPIHRSRWRWYLFGRKGSMIQWCNWLFHLLLLCVALCLDLLRLVIVAWSTSGSTPMLAPGLTAVLPLCCCCHSSDRLSSRFFRRWCCECSVLPPACLGPGALSPAAGMCTVMALLVAVHDKKTASRHNCESSVVIAPSEVSHRLVHCPMHLLSLKVVASEAGGVA